MSDWYYERNGARLGPHTDIEILGLAQAGQVLSDTLCWQKDFGSDWKPFTQTELCKPTQVSGPPPLPASHVGGLYAWLYAFTPLIGAAIEQIIVMNSGVGDIPREKSIWFYMLAYGILAGLDSKAIERSGNQKVPKMWWFLFAPAYLWVRSRALSERRKVKFWVMMSALAGTVVIADPDVGKEFFLGASLPACDGKYAEREVIQLFGTLPLAKMAGVNGLSLSGQRETSGTATMRFCTGTLALRIALPTRSFTASRSDPMTSTCASSCSRPANVW